jgi:aminopeptidase-like protein
MTEGDAIHAFASELYPICRSITGDGVRRTLRLMSEHVPLSISEVPTGTPVFDWTVPQEWNVEGAYVADAHGRRIIDFDRHNLHLVNYSIPFKGSLTKEQLLPQLHSIPSHPKWIPYRTAYYQPRWGFCLPDDDLKSLPDGTFDVNVDTRLTDGALTYGEYFLPGRSSDEVLIYSHICHPSLGNDNLSGLGVTLWLAKQLTALPRRFSYRFVWAPATIGAITWLAVNRPKLKRIVGGLVAVLLGDSAEFTYKRSQRGDTQIDRILSYAVQRHNGRVIEFDPYGYDERQFCSPGIDLAVGRISRSVNGGYAEYHTSADNLEFIKPESLVKSLDLLLEVVELIEHNRVCVNLQPFGEPQLGRRGLYRNTGGENLPDREYSMLWVLNQCDGRRSLLDVAERAQLPFRSILSISDELERAGLLRDVDATTSESNI